MFEIGGYYDKLQQFTSTTPDQHNANNNKSIRRTSIDSGVLYVNQDS